MIIIYYDQLEQLLFNSIYHWLEENAGIYGEMWKWEEFEITIEDPEIAIIFRLKFGL